jgi:hypothetical protein
MKHLAFATFLAGAVLASGSARAATLWTGDLLGSNEVPPTGSPATGFVSVSLLGNQLTVDLTYTGLTGGNPAAAHIHCCTAPGSSIGVAVGFPGFPATLSGTYIHTFDLTDPTVYTSAFFNNAVFGGGGTVAGAEAALIVGLDAGHAYANIHNGMFPGGEIRALLTTPEPSTLLLLSAGILIFAGKTRRKR